MLGLLHDIGYIHGAKNHSKYGAELLKSIGLSQKMANAVMLHGSSVEKIRETYPQKIPNEVKNS